MSTPADDSPAQARNTDRKWTWTLLLPAVSAILGHVLSLRNGYTLDDPELIVENPYLHTFAGLLQMFPRSLFIASGAPATTEYYRPVVYVINWISWQLFGDYAPGHHAMNVVMHAVVSMLLCFTLQRWNVRRSTAIVVASLFAVHPATADVVAYLGGRHDMIGWIFALITIAVLPRISQKPALQVLTGALTTILCLFSREAFIATIVCLPFLVALESGRKQLNLRGAGALTAGIALGFGVVTAARTAAHVKWMVTSTHLGLDIWLKMAAGVGVRLFEDLVAPTDLVVDMVPWQPPVIVAALLLVAASLTLPLFLWQMRDTEKKPYALGAFGILLALSISAIHVPIALRQGFVSDRYAYPLVIAAAFFLGPVGNHLGDLIATHLSTSPLRRVLPLVPWALMLAYAPLTWARDVDWMNETTLQAQMERVRPEDPMSKFAACARLVEAGQFEEGLKNCAEYAEHFPKTWRTHRTEAIALLGLGRKAEAIKSMKQLTALKPEQTDTRIMLISTLFELNRLDEIEEVLNRWSPAFDEQRDVIAARHELARRRALSGQKHATPPPAQQTAPLPLRDPTRSEGEMLRQARLTSPHRSPREPIPASTVALW